MNSHATKSRKLSLDELVFDALSQLQVLQYNQRSIRRYQTVWRKLIIFAERQGHKGKLREQLILDFLEHHQVDSRLPVQSQKGWKKHAEHSLTLLWHFARFGYFERGKTYAEKLRIPATMQRSQHDFKRYCEEERYLSPHTVNEYVRQVGLFLDFLGRRDVKNFTQIHPEDLSDFVYSLSRYRRKTVASIVSCVRLYLRFLFFTHRLNQDLSSSLPGVFFPHRASIPSVWDKELLAQLLDRIDRHSPRGKRDYAIVLLACRLGVRSGDIKTLTLDDIDWVAETITFTQAKTKLPLRLPLTEEVGNALIDYIQSVRPITQSREVFFTLRPPFRPFMEASHLCHIVSYWQELAGIHFRTPQRHGLHSLRHSLATRLLEDDVPFSVIADILGHASMNSTMIYAKASIESLRQVALSVEEVGHADEA
jgi:site-specific recombinase XerD